MVSALLLSARRLAAAPIGASTLRITGRMADHEAAAHCHQGTRNAATLPPPWSIVELEENFEDASGSKPAARRIFSA